VNGKHLRIYCSDCKKKVTITHKEDKAEELLQDHLNRNSNRILALENDMEKKTICKMINILASELIDSNNLTVFMCPQSYCGIIIVDGKCIGVKEAKQTVTGRKAKTKKGLVGITFMDYETHDIPIHILAASENMHDIEQGFLKLKEIGYPLKAVVCDESMGEIMMVAKKVFPDVIIQLCLTHFSAKIDRNMQVNSAKRKITALEKKLDYLGKSILIPSHRCDQEKARQIVNQIADIEYEYYPLITLQKILQKIFWEAQTEEEINILEDDLNFFITEIDLKKYPHAQKIRSCYDDYYKKRDFIIAAIRYPECNIPKTTNLIEGYHSTSLEIRLNGIRGFEHEETAAHYINALILKRRFQKFTDCKGKFKHLNGKSPLQISNPKNLFGFNFDSKNWIHFCKNLHKKLKHDALK
jgi:hypothetical protein